MSNITKKDISRRRLLNRVLLVLSANLAVGVLWVGHYAVQRFVLEPNAARMLVSMFNPVALDALSQAEGKSEKPVSPRHPGQILADYKRLEKQTVIVDTIVRFWRWGLWAVAGLMEVLVLVAAVTGRLRWPQLLVAGLMLLLTAGTLWAMYLVGHPRYGGMAAPPWSWYFLTAAGPVAYAALLLVIYTRQAKE